MSHRRRLAALLVVLCAIATAVQAALPTFWTVSTEADFLRGEVENLSIDTYGRLTALGHAVARAEVERLLDDERVLVLVKILAFAVFAYVVMDGFDAEGLCEVASREKIAHLTVLPGVAIDIVLPQ